MLRRSDFATGNVDMRSGGRLSSPTNKWSGTITAVFILDISHNRTTIVEMDLMTSKPDE